MSKKITFIGMPRSGNHGIINWLISAFDDNVLFFNNVRHKLVENQYKDVISENKPTVVIASIEAEDLINCLNNPNFHQAEASKILLLRDPFNLYSSKRKYYSGKSAKFHYGEKKVHCFIRDWKQYAREYLGKTNYIGDKMPLSYNRWVVDEEYRKGILKSLGAVKLDVPHNKMMKRRIDPEVVGGTSMVRLPGSSFDKFKYKENTDEMDLFGRWHYYENTWAFSQILGDKELMDLSEEIFGEIVH